MNEKQLYLLNNLVEEKIQDLKNEAELYIMEGRDVKKNNSYSNESTGYNLVEDYELTKDYENLLNQIEQYENLLTKLNDLICQTLN